MEVVGKHCTKQENGTPVDKVREPLLAAVSHAFVVIFLMLQYFVAIGHSQFLETMIQHGNCFCSPRFSFHVASLLFHLLSVFLSQAVSFCHRSVVKYTSCLLQWRSRCET